jgi:hypothetical protein
VIETLTANPFVQRTRDSRFCLHFVRQWSLAADNRRWARSSK